MKTFLYGSLSALALIALALPTRTQAEDPGIEFGFMPRTMLVTLLNEGGKYVAIDLKHIDRGGSCRMDEGATIARVGAGAAPGTVRVRYAAAQVSSGGCPFMTSFDLPEADYAKARAAFVEAKEEALKRVDEIKKGLGNKWDELTGKKS